MRWCARYVLVQFNHKYEIILTYALTERGYGNSFPSRLDLSNQNAIILLYRRVSRMLQQSLSRVIANPNSNINKYL